VREKYCSGWKNKLNKTDYKPDEQGLTWTVSYPLETGTVTGSSLLVYSIQCTNADLDFAAIEFVLLSASVCITNLRGLDFGVNVLQLWSVFLSAHSIMSNNLE
jgi:hypothetical protein